MKTNTDWIDMLIFALLDVGAFVERVIMFFVEAAIALMLWYGKWR